MDAFKRTRLLIGKENSEKLSSYSVAVFGIGGVGGFAVEALARSGVGNFTLVDNDTVAESNINRQIIADINTVGKLKTEVMKQRILSINPSAKVEYKNLFFLPENAGEMDFSSFDYVIDAVDTVSAKLAIIECSKACNVPVISCMGTGGKLNPSLLKVADIKETSVCPLARVMRKELKERNIDKVKVVFSTEEPKSLGDETNAEKKNNGRIAPPSMVFVPSMAGILMASEVVKDLLSIK